MEPSDRRALDVTRHVGSAPINLVPRTSLPGYSDEFEFGSWPSFDGFVIPDTGPCMPATHQLDGPRSGLKRGLSSLDDSLSSLGDSPPSSWFESKTSQPKRRRTETMTMLRQPSSTVATGTPTPIRPFRSDQPYPSVPGLTQTFQDTQAMQDLALDLSSEVRFSSIPIGEPNIRVCSQSVESIGQASLSSIAFQTQSESKHYSVPQAMRSKLNGRVHPSSKHITWL